MQSQARRMKRIMAGLQNPMPNSTKIAHSSINNDAVNRTHKFGKSQPKLRSRSKHLRKQPLLKRLKT